MFCLIGHNHLFAALPTVHCVLLISWLMDLEVGEPSDLIEGRHIFPQADMHILYDYDTIDINVVLCR